MAESVYNGLNTNLIFAEETVFGTPVAPSGSSYFDKVTTFSYTVANNLIPIQGIGDGRNATHAVNGVLDVTGNLGWDVTDANIFQYMVGAVRSGAGTAGDPYELQEVNTIGYLATEMPTLTLEKGSEGGSNDDAVQIDGVTFNTWTLNANVGEKVTCTADFIGRNVTSSTAVETYTGPANRPMTFVDGSLDVNGDTVGKVQSVSLTCNNNIQYYRSIGSRLINLPVFGIRRYEFSITLKLNYNDAASTISGLEARGLTFTGVTTATSPGDIAEMTAATMSLDLVEGASSGDRVINFDFENVYFGDYTEPISVDDNVIEITINGIALAGLTDGSVQIPIRYWTI